MRATSTLTSGARILAATRLGVQRHWRPFSIRSRDNLAMVVVSAGRANCNDSSKLFMRCTALRIRLYLQRPGAIKFKGRQFKLLQKVPVVPNVRVVQAVQTPT